MDQNRDIRIGIGADYTGQPAVERAKQDMQRLRTEIATLRAEGMKSSEIARTLVAKQELSGGAAFGGALQLPNVGAAGDAAKQMSAANMAAKQFTSSLIGAGAIIATMRSGLRTVREELESAVIHGTDLQDALARAAGEAAKQIPIAGDIGSIIALLNPVYREHLEMTEQIAKRRQEMVERGRQQLALEAELARFTDGRIDAENKLALLRAPDDAARSQLQRDQALADLDRRIAAERKAFDAKGYTGEGEDQTLAEIEATQRTEIDRINEEFAQRERKRKDEMVEKARDASLKQQEAVESAEQRIATLRAQFRENELRQMGMAIEAEIAESRRLTEEKIAALQREAHEKAAIAQEGSDQILSIAEQEAAALRALVAQRIDMIREEAREKEVAAKRKAQQESTEKLAQMQRDAAVSARRAFLDRATGRGGAVEESRFLTRAPGSDMQGGIKEIAEKADKQLVEMRKQTKASEKMAATLEQINQGRLVVKESRLRRG